jgi:hypothetical protein
MAIVVLDDPLIAGERLGFGAAALIPINAGGGVTSPRW